MVLSEPGMETEERCECGDAFLVKKPKGTLVCPSCEKTKFSEEQLETINNITPRGFHLNSGMPCECGAGPYSTSKSVGYSDFVTYAHSCSECGNEFSTYIEG